MAEGEVAVIEGRVKMELLPEPTPISAVEALRADKKSAMD